MPKFTMIIEVETGEEFSSDRRQRTSEELLLGMNIGARAFPSVGVVSYTLKGVYDRTIVMEAVEVSTEDKPNTN